MERHADVPPTLSCPYDFSSGWIRSQVGWQLYLTRLVTFAQSHDEAVGADAAAPEDTISMSPVREQFQPAWKCQQVVCHGALVTAALAERMRTTLVIRST